MVGVGFGPSNLALAVAIAERNERAADPAGATTAVFLEQQPGFGWHRGMLLDDATMQVSFLKDLVTLRDPSSEFSFLCYLHDKGRLIDFINHKSLFPLRVEFHDYLEWAAARVDDLVCYGHEVVSVAPAPDAGCLDVTARTRHGSTVYRARNLVFGTGLRPGLPTGLSTSDRIWHNSELLHRVDALPAQPRRFVVLGAGQSGAEVAAFLHQRFTGAEVCAVFSRYGYSPADDSPFANRIFDPDAVTEFFGAPGEVKDMLADYHSNTNYSVVDAELIDELYRRAYQEKVLGAERLRLFNACRLAGVRETGDGVRLTIESLTTGAQTTVDADALVCATGYRPADPFPLLGPIARQCQRDAEGRPVVDRDYRLRTDPGLDSGLYLQGGTEHSHGITSSLLSNVAIRAGEILRSVAVRRPAPDRQQLPSGVPA
ncbi:MAG TPA: lysine N(6)-hydroxylase/L-ornithine N(5)-oxygenase family protein [Mycobacteriales bacterium]|nr:lysine N(6)-hydroxylase/L-ornithine N(5)-oxygenase family protein [Mycobacteriales bacterium]